MKQYILLIQGNTTTSPRPEEWENFFSAARASGIFSGGSEIGKRETIGESTSGLSTDHIVGYMRFDTDDKSQVLDLLKLHPIVLHGGTVELCEMPRSGAL